MSDQTIFMFNSTSADKPPGSGVMEKISMNDKKQNVYSTLRKFTNWRKMLSNEFPMVNSKLGSDGLYIDENKWMSVEHYLIGCNAKLKSVETFEKCTLDGEYGNESIANLKNILKIKKYEHSKDDLHKALEAKFNYEKNPNMCKVLLATNKAILTSWKRGMSCDVDSEGNKTAKVCDFTDYLMKIRDNLFTSSSSSLNHLPQEQTQHNSSILSKKHNLVNSSTTKRITKSKSENTPSTDVSSNASIDSNYTSSTSSQNADGITTKTNNVGGFNNDVKILSKKEIDNYSDFISKYNPDKNKSSNILTVYEKTNILGIRMEQLALGADSYLDHERANKIGDVKEIAKQEFKEKKIPFIICRVLPDNTKEYWKLEHMNCNNCYL